MTKFRIYEIAKEANRDIKDVMNVLQKHKVAVKSSLNSVDESMRELVLKELSGKKTEAPKAPRPETQSRKTPAAPEKSGEKAAASVHTAPAHKASAAATEAADRTTQKPDSRQETRSGRPGDGQQSRSHDRHGSHNGSFTGNNVRGDSRDRQDGRDSRNPRRENRDGRGSGTRSEGRDNARRSDGRGSSFNRSGDRMNVQGQGNGSGHANFRRNSNNNRGGSAHGDAQTRKNGQHNGRTESPVGMNSAHAGKDMGKHGNNFARKDKKEKIKGSYASRETRQTHSADHMVKNHKNRKQNQNSTAMQKKTEIVRPSSVEVGESISVKEFARLLGRDVNEIIKKLFMLGKMVTINQEIDHETAELVGLEFDCEIKEPPPEEDPTEVPEVEDDPALRVPRPPVVTVMGHVDHGKTSLLDATRKTNVTAREAGGITQHIGAYRVICQGHPIVFLDTPGHEAFTAMRARGAQVTDIAVLVVAADDGVMPQTLEAINHARAAKVPIIVAINKIDKEGANPDFVMQQLSEHGLIPEAWGGDTIMVPVSARQKTGISDLLEMILLVADMLELKANPKLPAHGTIIEAKLDKGRGPVATVLIDRGTLHIGDSILCGTTYGKVRAMVNDRGEKVKKALPSTPVEVLGLNDVPEAGDSMDALDEHLCRSIAEKRLAKAKMEEQKKAKVSLDDIFNRIQEGEMKELNIVVKADVQGTIEALNQALTNIKNSEVKVVVVHSGVGTINESDVMLASASNALIIGFNVRPDANARKAADTEKVDIRTYRVIYDALNDVQAAIKGMLAPKFKEKVIGHVEIRKVIPINKALIAGAYVKDGKITRTAKVRLIRDGIVIHEGELDSLRRFKDDVKEVAASYECGLTLQDYRDIREGDQLEVYVMEEVAAE